MDTILENENAEAPQEERLLPVVALGAAAIRMARILNEKFGGLDLYEILDILEKGESLEFAPTFAIPESRPIRFLMYDRAEVEDGMAKAVAEKAKTGGKLFTFEIAAPGEKMRPSWRLGTDVLVRAKDEAQCLAAAGLSRTPAPTIKCVVTTKKSCPKGQDLKTLLYHLWSGEPTLSCL